MYCSQCGVENSDSVTQCTNCGCVLGDTPPQQAVPPVPVGKPKTCGMAIAAFVMGLLSLTCVLWPLLVLPAVICGIVALVKINGSKGQLKGTVFAVAGLVIPGVLTFIVPVLVVFFVPAFSTSKQYAQKIQCMSNLYAISVAMKMYADEYDGEYPTSDQWCDLLIDGSSVSPEIFHCAIDKEGSFSYAINGKINDVESRRLPSKMVVLFESNLGRNGAGGPEDVVMRHNVDGQICCHIMFADGSVEFVAEDRIPDLIWKVE